MHTQKVGSSCFFSCFELLAAAAAATAAPAAAIRDLLIQLEWLSEQQQQPQPLLEAGGRYLTPKTNAPFQTWKGKEEEEEEEERRAETVEKFLRSKKNESNIFKKSDMLLPN